MLYEMDRALNVAMHDDAIKAVIIGADGPHFSSGHHMKDRSHIGEFGPPIMGVGGYRRPGQEGHMAMEQEVSSASAGAGATCPSQPSPRCRARPSPAG